jgi:hypothetical protein
MRGVVEKRLSDRASWASNEPDDMLKILEPLNDYWVDFSNLDSKLLGNFWVLEETETPRS